MKKLFIFSVLVVVFVGFTACGGGGGGGELSSTKEITSFKVNGIAYTPSSNGFTHSYKKTAANTWEGLPEWGAAPEIVHNGKSIDPPASAKQNFENGVTYTVTAEDGSTKSYYVKADKGTL